MLLAAVGAYKEFKNMEERKIKEWQPNEPWDTIWAIVEGLSPFIAVGFMALMLWLGTSL